MASNRFRCFLVVSLVASSYACALASDDPWFHEKDPLAPRDQWGVFSQTAPVIPADYFPRWGSRLYYNFKSGEQLLADPAYVAGLQNVLRRNGYYCGPINGVMSQAVSIAIGRMQKNHTMRVTGTLTVAVRRALFLPYSSLGVRFSETAFPNLGTLCVLIVSKSR